MNIVMLMAGERKGFEEHSYLYPNYLLEIQNKSLIQHIVESVSPLAATILFIIRKEDDAKYFLGDVLRVVKPGSNIITVENITKGAVCTSLFAIDAINNTDELVLMNGDQLIKSDIKAAIDSFRVRNLDGGLITFKSIHPRWSYAALDGHDLVIQTSEKRPISDIAIAGCYYYKQGCDFVSSAFKVIEKDIRIQDRYFTSSTYNEMILKQKKIGIYNIAYDDYISFANYQMYESYMYYRRKYDD